MITQLVGVLLQLRLDDVISSQCVVFRTAGQQTLFSTVELARAARADYA